MKMINLSLNPEVADWLQSRRIKHGIPMTWSINAALREYMNRQRDTEEFKAGVETANQKKESE